MAAEGKTRSGKAYSAYASPPYLCPEAFSFQPLLEAALQAEGEPPDEERALEAEASSPPPLKRARAGDPLPRSPDSRLPMSQQEGGRKRARQRLKRSFQKLKAGCQASPGHILRAVREEEAEEREVGLLALPATSCGYQARPFQARREKFDLNKLKADGFEVFPWDGRTARPFVDPVTKKVFMVLAGQPDKASFREACDRVAKLIIRLGRSAKFSEDETQHRRGDSPALNCGVSHGKGSTRAHNLYQGVHQEMLQELLADEDVRRLAIFGSYSFELWAPDVYQYYSERLGPLYSQDPALKKLFDRSIFPAAAFNFGPQVCCYPHRDNLNCPFGWCSIQALGQFDSTKGGHLVLPDLKLIIEFPPGAVILLPSATLIHGNTPVQPGETRVSFTQYCPGGLLRFVDNGFRTERGFRKKDPAGHAAMMAQKEGRWEMGLGLLSTIGELLRRAKPANAGPPKDPK